jgi:hypothetical protein
MKDGRHVGLDFYDLLIEALLVNIGRLRPRVSGLKVSAIVRGGPLCSAGESSKLVLRFPRDAWRRRAHASAIGHNTQSTTGRSP